MYPIVTLTPLKQLICHDLNLIPHYTFRFLDGRVWLGGTDLWCVTPLRLRPNYAVCAKARVYQDQAMMYKA